MPKLKVGSDYSGVGAFLQALKRLNIDFDEEFACDYDEYARQSYIKNYGTEKDIELVMSKEHSIISKKIAKLIETGQVFKAENADFLAEADTFARQFSFYYPWNVYNREIPNNPIDIYMTSPPCQGFSLAGLRKGSILFMNSLEFIKINKPQFFIFENVKGLLSHDKKNKKNKSVKYGRTFNEWTNYLGGKSINGAETIFPYPESVPYHIFFKVLTAKHYGVPQNRPRIFIIGIRDDVNNNFQWPKEFQLKKALKDVLEIEVDEKYFLSETLIEYFLTHKEDHKNRGNGFKFEPRDINKPSLYISTKAGSRQTDNFIDVTKLDKVLKENSIIHNIYGGFNEEIRIFNKISPVIRTWSGGGAIPSVFKNNRIRKLTPRECFRLMDFPEDYKIVVSDTQAYKQAGNSIVVEPLALIIAKLLKIPYHGKQD